MFKNTKLNSIQKTCLSSKPLNLEICGKDEILLYLENSFKLEEQLYRSIKIEKAFYENWEKYRHPLYFYLIHSAAFYINKLRKSGANIKQINIDFEESFAQGVDPELNCGVKKINKKPTLKEIWNYRAKVYQIMRDWILTTNLNLPIKKGSHYWALMMSMEHQRIHLETSSLIIRQMPVEYLKAPHDWIMSKWSNNKVKSNFVKIERELVHFGARNSSEVFTWDNETGSKSVEVDSFFVSNYLVSNSEFMNFVDDEGYKNSNYWTDEGKTWLQSHHILHPPFWIKKDDKYLYRSLFIEHELPDDWPVEVNYYEAMAYVNWKSNKDKTDYRLMSEAEYYVLQSKCTEININANLKYSSSTSVNKVKNKINDIRGNVWQWLQTDFYPLPGFELDDLYLDFSSPYFNQKYKMLLGGSWISTGTQLSPYYRLWFRKHIYQNAGIRLVKDVL